MHVGICSVVVVLLMATGAPAEDRDARAAPDGRVGILEDKTPLPAPPGAGAHRIHEVLLGPDANRAAGTSATFAAPPAPRDERPWPVTPSDPSQQWIAGYWDRDPARGEFVWVPGLWYKDPLRRVWIDGRWTRDAWGLWVRSPGRWWGPVPATAGGDARPASRPAPVRPASGPVRGDGLGREARVF